MTVLASAPAAPSPSPRHAAEPKSDHPRIAHRPALDGLRGLAVAGVLLYHGGHLSGGFLGVDLFFVLSGYLITALLLVEARDRKHINLGQFWLRRARRLLPAIFAVLLAIALYSRIVADPTQWTAIRGDGLATLFYVANWHTIFGGMAYGADVAARSPLEHTWSLAIEEQFYVIWPLVVAGVLAIRRTPGAVLWAAAAVTAVGTAMLIGLSLAGVSQNTLYLGTHTRMPAIGIGAMVAAYEASRPQGLSIKVRRWIELAGPAVLVMLLVGWTQFDLHDQFLYRGGLTLSGVLVGLLIWGVIQPDDTTLGRVLSVRPLCALGLISYGLYLWHWPIFLLLDEARTGISGWPLFVLRVAVSLAIAWVSYRFLEQPIRRSSWGGLRVTTFAGFAAAVAALALVASAVGAPPGVFAGANGGPTFTAAPGQTPTLALYGDSVAYLLGRDGITPKVKDLGVSLYNSGRLGCEPLGGVTDARDDNQVPIWSGSWQNCLDKLPFGDGKARPVDVAVLLFGGVQWDAKIDGTWRSPCEPEYQSLYRDRIGEAVRLIQGRNTPVVVIKPPPVVSDILRDKKGLTDGVARAACSWEALAPVLARPGVHVVDLDAHLCDPKGQCDKDHTDADNRFDGIHFEGDDAVRVARWLIPAVLKAAKG
jgi:peptidoglycan/LPS O-acetylase OafA/YrhL